VDVLENTNCY